MNTYLSLLRGINVTGKNKILMADLSQLFLQLGFKEAKTYIQSGNIIFNADKSINTDEISKLIEVGILNQWGYDVACTTLNKGYLQEVLDNNPFLGKGEESARIYYSFLIDTPTQDKIDKLMGYKFPPDEFALRDKVIYLRCDKYGETKLSNTFFEKVLKVKATTRNHNTVITLNGLLGYLFINK